jgi:hypothetical protein
VPPIQIFRRLLGMGEPDLTTLEAVEPDPTPDADDDAAEVSAPSEPETAGVACPSCGFLIDPAPTRNRRCPACREPIVVRQINGRPAYLTEAALEVFLGERAREAAEAANEVERERWLHLAATVDVPAPRRQRIAEAPPTEEAVEAARRLYESAAERAVRSARHELRYADVARIHRAHATAAFEAAGSPIPPPAEIVALHQDGMLALLRSFAAQGTAVELVSARCCPACRADDGHVFRISDELRTPRLPHADCPKGLCGCDWWIGVLERKRRRRRSRAG